MKKIYTTLALLLCVMMMTTCKKYEAPTSLLEYTLSEVTVSSTIAVVEGDYTYDSDVNVNVLYGKNSDLSDALKEEADVQGKHFRAVITGLEAEIQYYYCVEFGNNVNTMRSEIFGFVMSAGGDIGGYQYVDLGLPSGIRWATHNVGAASPECYGDYYAWGELNPKNAYTPENCSTDDVYIDDISGNEQYDVATKNWGDMWRIPKYFEFRELEEQCTWEAYELNGVKGSKVTGPNGNHIFMPSCGYMDGGEVSSASVVGAYWLSTPSGASNEDKAYCGFVSGASPYHNTTFNKYIGANIRPVFDPVSPQVKTKEIGNITQISAECAGEVTFEGWSMVYERGICWNTSGDPTVKDNHISSGSGMGEFKVTLFNLTSETKYYVRAYAENEKGVVYGEQKNFETLGTALEVPRIAESEVIEYTTTTIVCEAFISTDGGSEVIEKGFCWSADGTPTISDNHTNEGGGIGEFTSTITGLQPATMYRVRAYAKNSVGISYGMPRVVVTDVVINVTGAINGYDYVDLGLPSGLKWATCNVGAESYREYGNYYSWGELNPKENYNNSILYDVEIEDISGNAAYDVARADCGSTWRMPKQEEMQELMDNCTFALYVGVDVNGFVLTGPNGNYMFLPAAGSKWSTTFEGLNTNANYWTSSPVDQSRINSHYLYIRKSDSYWYISGMNRSYGCPIRPVSN